MKKMHLKCLQINKGNSSFPKYIEIISTTIKDNSPSIASICESNVEKDQPELNHTNFPDFNFESKFMGTLETARLTVLIKNNVDYERVYDL